MLVPHGCYIFTHYLLQFQISTSWSVMVTVCMFGWMWMCLRSLQKTGEVVMVVAEQLTAEGRSLAVACGVAATSKPWAMMTAPTRTRVPKPRPSPHWLPRGKPSDDLSAWIKGQMAQIQLLYSCWNTCIYPRLNSLLSKTVKNTFIWFSLVVFFFKQCKSSIAYQIGIAQMWQT